MSRVTGREFAVVCHAWSDVHDEKPLGRLIDRLAVEMCAWIGHEFTIVRWAQEPALGQDRERTLDQAVRGAVPLLVIVTPELFRSEACRAEVARFRQRELELGRADLIVPVYYRAASQWQDADDEVAALLAARMAADWRELGYQAADSPLVRKAVARLSFRLREVLRQPPPVTATSAPASPARIMTVAPDASNVS